MTSSSMPVTQRSLPIALIRAREKVMAPIREMLSSLGITEQQWRVLRVLAEHEVLDATHLAERAALHQPSLTRILKTLEERGLITRQTDAEDRRRQVVALAEAGHRLITENLAQAMRIADAIRQHMGAEDMDRILDLLTRLEGFTMDPPEAG